MNESAAASGFPSSLRSALVDRRDDRVAAALADDAAARVVRRRAIDCMVRGFDVGFCCCWVECV